MSESIATKTTYGNPLLFGLCNNSQQSEMVKFENEKGEISQFSNLSRYSRYLSCPGTMFMLVPNTRLLSTNTVLRKVRQNEWNRDRSKNARRPKAKTFPTRNRLARNGICRRERHVHDVCRDICWQKTNLLTTKKIADRICWQKEDLLTTKICWRILLTKTKSADSYTTCWL